MGGGLRAQTLGVVVWWSDCAVRVQVLTPCPGTNGPMRKAYKPWKESVLHLLQPSLRRCVLPSSACRDRGPSILMGPPTITPAAVPRRCVLLDDSNVDGQYLQLAWPEAGGEHVTGSKTPIKDPKIVSERPPPPPGTTLSFLEQRSVSLPPWRVQVCGL